MGKRTRHLEGPLGETGKGGSGLFYTNGFLVDGEPVPGLCCVCGCEEDNACDGGCEWVNVDRTLCSSCLTLLGRIPLRMFKRYAGKLPSIAELGPCMPKRSAKKGGGRHG